MQAPDNLPPKSSRVPPSSHAADSDAPNQARKYTVLKKISGVLSHKYTKLFLVAFSITRLVIGILAIIGLGAIHLGHPIGWAFIATSAALLLGMLAFRLAKSVRAHINQTKNKSTEPTTN